MTFAITHGLSKKSHALFYAEVLRHSFLLLMLSTASASLPVVSLTGKSIRCSLPCRALSPFAIARHCRARGALANH
jgi:hypothetical protein